ncbi:hypothetical protein HMPREF1624_06950 [Sporothrix schenckii ATCC 58251]|uniref:Uncharacterized protein n=1 Tax=Sporothrix schenckii (strain ATCC 58251 / de Perez 2211183) TaxID=1391915 RepID=U7PP67_SPOS1|nr:hypothetical protein HMPREF1624_06950 [Sporothrix schenckii ATCC 58251]
MAEFKSRASFGFRFVLRWLLSILLLVSTFACTASAHAGSSVHHSPLTGDVVNFFGKVPASNNATGRTNATASRNKYLPPPSKDAWYAPPAGWESTKPGTVLRTRPHAYPTINIRNAIDTFQVLYRTSDSHSNASWSVATVFIPKSHAHCVLHSTSPAYNASACAHAMVAYEVPSDSADPDAAPSYLLQMREPYGEMRDMLARGWFVLVPDYEGPNASFCAGVQAGHATLDATRAVLSLAGPQLGLRTDAVKVGLWGYSGGAFAAEFAAELAATYAPELRIDASVIGGSSPNLTTVDERMNAKDTAGLVVTSILGITVQQPEARAFLLQQLHPTGPYNKTTFLNATTMTGADALDAYSGQNVFDYFVNGRSDWANPAMQDVINADAVMGLHGVPRMPSFYYKAAHDEMSPVDETAEIVTSFCRQGANILFHRNTVGGHNDELWSGRLRALDYLSAKLDGAVPADSTSNLTIPATGCATVDVTIPLDPLYLLPDWWWTEGPGAGLGLMGAG